MAVYLSPVGNGQQFFLANGLPNNGGFINTYLAGSTTPATTYTTNIGNVANANPIQLSAGGLLPNEIWFAGGVSYKFAITDSTGAVLQTLDNLIGMSDFTILAASTGAALIGWIQAGAAAVLRLVRDKLRDHINAKDYGIVGDGTDEHVAIQALITQFSGRKIVFNKPASAYSIGSTTITIPSNTTLDFESYGNGRLTYSGAGVAVDCAGSSHVSINGLALEISDNAAVGIRMGGGSQQCRLVNVGITGNESASNAGSAIWLDGASSGAFSGNLALEQIYILGMKYGIKFTGVSADQTWTSVSGVNCYILGRGAGIIAGSAGIYMDALSNGVGTTFIGGTIEGFDDAILHINGGFGLFYTGDIEANNRNYTVGASFNGQINIHPAGKFFRAGSNGTSNIWMKERHIDGVWQTETRGSRTHVALDPGGIGATMGFKYGASEIDGGTADRVLAVVTDGSYIGGANRIYTLSHAMYYTANPATMTGSFIEGDTAIHQPPSIGNPRGWTCTTTGVNGAAVWTAWANL